MKRVFLDQNHWVTLARVQQGKELRRDLVEVHDLIVHSATQGLASFPLDSSRYFETMKRGDPHSRQQLGEVMYRVSRSQTMANIIHLLEPEATCALARHFRKPTPPPPQVFGVGARHAFGLGAASYFSDPEIEQRAWARWGRKQVEGLFEEALIVGPSEQLPVDGIARPNDNWGLKQLQDEIAIRDRIAAVGHTPGLAGRVVMAGEAMHALAGLNRIAASLGLPAVTVNSREEIEYLFGWMPSRHLLARMRMTAHANAQFKWERGDLVDLTSLAVAAAYCDIVVTERKWGDVLTRARMPTSATVLTRLQDLPTILLG